MQHLGEAFASAVDPLDIAAVVALSSVNRAYLCAFEPLRWFARILEARELVRVQCRLIGTAEYRHEKLTRELFAKPFSPWTRRYFDWALEQAVLATSWEEVEHDYRATRAPDSVNKAYYEIGLMAKLKEGRQWHLFAVQTYHVAA